MTPINKPDLLQGIRRIRETLPRLKLYIDQIDINDAMYANYLAMIDTFVSIRAAVHGLPREDVLSAISAMGKQSPADTINDIETMLPGLINALS